MYKVASSPESVACCLANSPESVASRLASEALKLIGEEIPHKLSQQVPLWSVEDVAHWVSEVCIKLQVVLSLLHVVLLIVLSL